jgi:hypothetical protein
MSTAALEAKLKATQTAAITRVPLAAMPAPAERRGVVSTRMAVPDPYTARALVISIIRRIEGYIDEENAALDKSLEFDFKASNDRKSQGLLELNQALRRLQRGDVNADLQTRLKVFREKLAVNLHKIRLHLEAVKEIAAMLSAAIQNAESDGTYTRNIGPYRNAP